MLALGGDTGILIQSDEVDVINRLRENERHRMRRAMIEEIRRKMRKAREQEGDGAEDNEDNGTKGHQVMKPKLDRIQLREMLEKAGSIAGDLSSAAGNGLKSAPGQGVFRQLNLKGKGKIYKHVTGDTTFWRQLNKRGKGKIWRPDTKKVAAVNKVGTALLVVSVAMDAYEIYTAVREDNKNGTKHNTVHTVSGIAGTWAGGIPAAAAGAAIGSVVPVVGSIIGGIVGGIVGSIGGGFLARTVATAVMPAPKQEEEDMIVETPGMCAFCSEKFASFDDFYVHFVQNHTSELICLYSAVVSRAGEENATIEDTWFVSMAFVADEDKIKCWGIEDILNFNDGILVKIGWNKEEEEDDFEDEEEVDDNELSDGMLEFNEEEEKEVERMMRELSAGRAVYSSKGRMMEEFSQEQKQHEEPRGESPLKPKEQLRQTLLDELLEERNLEQPQHLDTSEQSLYGPKPLGGLLYGL